MFKALQLCDTKFTSVSKSVDGKDEVEWEEVKLIVLKEAEPEWLTPLGTPARAFRLPSPRGQPPCHISQITANLCDRFEDKTRHVTMKQKQTGIARKLRQPHLTRQDRALFRLPGTKNGAGV